jgi:hypothetical protein
MKRTLVAAAPVNDCGEIAIKKYAVLAECLVFPLANKVFFDQFHTNFLYASLLSFFACLFTLSSFLHHTRKQ